MFQTKQRFIGRMGFDQETWLFSWHLIVQNMVISLDVTKTNADANQKWWWNDLNKGHWRLYRKFSNNYIHIWIFVYTYIYLYVYMYIVYIYMYKYIYIYTYIYICIQYIYIYVYIYAKKWRIHGAFMRFHQQKCFFLSWILATNYDLMGLHCNNKNGNLIGSKQHSYGGFVILNKKQCDL